MRATPTRGSLWALCQRLRGACRDSSPAGEVLLEGYALWKRCQHDGGVAGTAGGGGRIPGVGKVGIYRTATHCSTLTCS